MCQTKSYIVPLAQLTVFIHSGHLKVLERVHNVYFLYLRKRNNSLVTKERMMNYYVRIQKSTDREKAPLLHAVILRKKCLTRGRGLYSRSVNMQIRFTPGQS